MPMRPSSRRRWWCAVALFGAAALLVASHRGAFRRAPPPLVPSRETTFLTGPIAADGMVDYAAALSEEEGRGATPVNNAWPLICRILGKDLDRLSSEELAAAPALETPFVDWYDWVAKNVDLTGRPDLTGKHDVDAFSVAEDASDHFFHGEANGPDSDLVRRWLDESRAPIELAKAVSLRTTLFLPFSGRVVGRPRPISAFRKMVPALDWRALRSMADGSSESAWSDLAAAFRLTQLLARQPILVDQLCATILTRITWTTARQLGATDRHLAAAQAREVLATRDERPLVDVLAPVLRTERITMLDGLNVLRRGMAAELTGWASDLERSIKPEAGASASVREPDTRRREDETSRFAERNADRLYRSANRWWDRIDSVCLGGGSWTEMIEQLEVLRSGADQYRRRSALQRWLDSPDATADGAADSMASLSLVVVAKALDCLVERVADSEVGYAELAALAFASEVGRDPVSTDELTPTLFATPFRDRLTGAPLQFHRESDGRLVASGPVVDQARALAERRSNGGPAR